MARKWAMLNPEAFVREELSMQAYLAARGAFSQARILVADVDVVELYDAFTINTILFLEDMGFCPKGEGGRFVEGGAIAPGDSGELSSEAVLVLGSEATR